MTAPLLSIITVCFNSASTIRETLLSVRQGKSELIEYIVIDGGSSDLTIDIIQEHNDIVDIFLSGPDGGIFDAMNKGLEVSSGLFVAFLNSDDIYLPGAIDLLTQQISSCLFVADVFYSDWMAKRMDGSTYLFRSDHRITARYQLCHQAMAIRRSCFPSPQGFDCRYRLCADFDLVLRLQQQRARFLKVNQPLVCFSEAGASSKYLWSSAFESICIRLIRSNPPLSFVFALRVAAFACKQHLFRSVFGLLPSSFIRNKFSF